MKKELTRLCCKDQFSRLSDVLVFERMTILRYRSNFFTRHDQRYWKQIMSSQEVNFFFDIFCDLSTHYSKSIVDMIQILIVKVVEYSTTCMKNVSLSLWSRDTSWSNKSISNDRRFLTRRAWLGHHDIFRQISVVYRRLSTSHHQETRRCPSKFQWYDSFNSNVTELNINLQRHVTVNTSRHVTVNTSANSYVNVSTYLSKRHHDQNRRASIHAIFSRWIYFQRLMHFIVIFLQFSFQIDLIFAKVSLSHRN